MIILRVYCADYMTVETNTQLGKIVLAIAEKGYGDVFDEVLLITVIILTANMTLIMVTMMLVMYRVGLWEGQQDSFVGFGSGVLMLIFSLKEWLGRKHEANLGKVSFKCAMVMSIRYDVQLVEVVKIITFGY